MKGKERKGNEMKRKEEYLYSAIYSTHTLKALPKLSDVDHSFTDKLPCLPFLRKRSPDGATPN